MIFHLELTSHSPRLWNLYTQLTFFYPCLSPSQHTNITTALQSGLTHLTTTFPWLSGQVTRSRPSRDHFIITSYPPHPAQQITFKNNTSTSTSPYLLPPYTTYSSLSFPISLLPESAVSPRATQSNVSEDEPKPVLLIQVTFIEGGVLLTFAANHAVLDVVGIGEVARLLSKACSGEEFEPEEVRVGNLDRRSVIPLLQGREEEDEEEQNKKSVPDDDTEVKNKHQTKPRNPSTNNTWSSFLFSTQSLQSLKISATEDPTVLTTDFISTDDVLSAFIWQSITRARLLGLDGNGDGAGDTDCDPHDTTTFARTVDVRRHLGVSPVYPGNLATKTYTTYTFRELIKMPLGRVASELRRGVDLETSGLGLRVRRAAGDGLGDNDGNNKDNPNGASGGGDGDDGKKRSRDLSRDLAFSSWAKLDYVHELEFGMGLGRPEAIRRPGFAVEGEEPMEGVVYLLPRVKGREVVVVVCLRGVDMDALRRDGEWRERGREIG